MKKLTALCLALLMALTLCACGSSAEDNLGKYTCTSIVMGDVNLGGGDEWIELQADGKAVLYMMSQTYNAEYTLEDSAFSLSVDGQAVATGTLENNTIRVDLQGMTCVFEQEAAGKCLVIAPEVDVGISRTEHDPEELERVYQMGRATGLKNLEKVREFLR